jgi:hypothetical protein
VELGPLGTSATEWPIVPAPGDCDDGEFGGMKIGRGNRSARDRGFESNSGHGCLVFAYVRASFCVCVQVKALRRADHPPKESYRLSKV